MPETYYERLLAKVLGPRVDTAESMQLRMDAHYWKAKYEVVSLERDALAKKLTLAQAALGCQPLQYDREDD